MKLSALLKSLACSELSTLNGFESGVAEEHVLPRAIQVINDSLLEIHSRLPIRSDVLTILTTSGMTDYKISSQFAATKNGPLQYIMDTPDHPYRDDLIRVTNIFFGDGKRVRINDETDCKSAFVPHNNMVQLPVEKDGETFFIAYQATHPEIKYDPLDAEWGDQEVEIPPYAVNAFKYLVASKYFDGMSGQDALGKAAVLHSKYEKACAFLEERQIIVDAPIRSGNRFRERGWV